MASVLVFRFHSGLVNRTSVLLEPSFRSGIRDLSGLEFRFGGVRIEGGGSGVEGVQELGVGGVQKSRL